MITLTYSLADQNFQTTKSVGIFNLSVKLLSGLAAHPEVSSLTVLSNSTFQDGLRLPKNVETQHCDRAIAGRFGRVWWDQWGVYQAASKAGREWLFLPKGFASFCRPCPVKLALYVHDTILESYYRKNPGTPRSELIYFRRCLRANLRYGRLIFTNSEFTKSEIERVAARDSLPLPPLVNVGIGFDSLPQPEASRDNEILVLASPLRHKRTDLAIAFLKRWQEQTKFDGKVRWVGNLPADLSLPQFGRWSHAARLPEMEYRQEVSRARVLVFFSEYEGFGMPPVEAIAHGVCPVYSELPSTQEVLAGRGCPFRNEDYESFSQAMKKALRMAPAQIESWREELLSRFNWNRVCTRAVEALKLHARSE